MTTICEPPPEYPAEITGYAEPWIVSPGDEVAIKLSCTDPTYSYQTVRIIQGVDVQHSPKKQEEIISTIPTGHGKGRYQIARSGSYAIVEDWVSASAKALDGIQLSFYLQPWLPKSGHVQIVVSTLDVANKTGFATVITEAGELDLWVGTGSGVEIVNTKARLESKRWVEVKATFQGREVTVSATPLSLFAVAGAPAITASKTLGNAVKFDSSSALLFGAGYAESPEKPSLFPTNVFNGRLDGPAIATTGPSSITLVKFDFARNMSSDTIVDVSGHGNHGRLFNAPTRAVKGYDWDGSSNDWTTAKYGYGAIHFHEDDVDDAGWDTDFTITIPKDSRSGAYCVNITSANATDSIPFFVRPSKEAWKQREGKVAFVMSTFTYLAYANEHLWDKDRASSIDIGPGFDMNSIAKSEDFDKLVRRNDVGISPYDLHKDGSGTVYSSAKRPILNLRPGYVMWAMKRPREFSADTMFIGLLEREKIPYEIVTDHDLHGLGAKAISGFNTVITGSHPEYPSLAVYDAYTAYARQGGNMMYLGGNGFYWVVSADLTTRPHRMEIRRGDQGVRTYHLPGGERINNIDGQYGGAWRSRGRSCNVLWGIGFCGEGAGPGVPYKRSEASKDPSFAWMFEGIGEDELIGEQGLGGGASGDEVDRFDTFNESPECCKVLATSTGHSDEFAIAPEDAYFPITNTLGTQTDLIRSDLTYYTNSGGGGVFSVGSINWFCSLGWDDYENNVAKLTMNVVKGFLKGVK